MEQHALYKETEYYTFHLYTIILLQQLLKSNFYMEDTKQQSVSTKSFKKWL